MEYILVGLVGLLFTIWLFFLWRDPKELKQTTWVYCPGCKQELVGSSERILTDTDFVRYFCVRCSTVSKWDFDMPVPVLVDSYYLDPNDWLNKR